MIMSYLFGSLKYRLLLLMLLVALPGFLTVIIHVQQQRESAINVSREQARFVVQHSVLHQQLLVENTRRYLELLADTIPVKKPSAPACSAYLASILKLNADYINLGVPGHDGELICSALPLEKPISVADRGYFKRTIENRTFAIGEFQQDRVADVISINFSYPVMGDDGAIIGAVVAVISLNWWSKYLAESGLPAGSVAVIADAEGFTIANFPSIREKIGTPVSPYSQRTAEEKGPILADQDGIRRVYFSAELYKTPSGRVISMSIGIPVEKEIAAANRQLYLSLLLMCGVMLLVLMMAIKGLKRGVLDPLSQLTRATRLLSQGRFSDVTLPRAAPQIMQLHHQFQDMAKKRLQAEQQALERNEELNSVFQALPDLYFRLDEEGTILDFKADVESDLYASPDDFLHKRMSEVMPESVNFMSHLQQLNDLQQLVGWEYSLELPSGKKYFEARLNRIAGSGQSVMVVRNVTAKKEADESLELSSMVFHSMSESILVTDADGLILDANPAFTQASGYSLDEVVGKTPALLRSGYQDTGGYEALWQELTREGNWEGEIYNLRKNGEIYPVWLTINTVYDEAGLPFRRIAMFIDFTEKKQAEEMIWQQAHMDILTGLPNRKLLGDRITQELEHTDRDGLSTAVLLLDLDLFKEVNDTLGHVIGDQLLIQVASRISSCVRSVDTVARQGGDEFIVILSQVKNMHMVNSICEDLLQTLSLPYLLGEETAYITASIGITLYPDDGRNANDLLKSADQAMYAAKQNGRNCFQYFTREMQEEAVKRMRLIADLRRAVTEHQFVLYYQPQVLMTDRSICKAEALIRWQHPEKGLVMPDEFIPTAEESHLILSIGSWVLEEATKTVLMLQQQYNPDFQLSVNISPVQFESLDSNISSWLEQLSSMGLSGQSVVAEITEGMMMSRSTEIREKMNAFKAAGVQVALDDFGTGYSSLAYISEYDIDYLKIDQYFVKNLALSSDAYTLCKAIIMMAHNLGIKVVAEGIETEQQHRLLLDLGCDYGQGYLYSKAVDLDAFEQLLRGQRT
ncbi:EAL domain-containing protein [Amphritea sp. 2_MG-2023]|uniref:bifunctional diguanylate cyclase/phosphodiesterase n=1 Tax=Amphritea TaxID=515417 RepID=UPI001C075A82|nr:MULTISPECIES: EAL domain-containing protein [Amphritea]MBU2965933.1 EAL domain-containing protein [Amphritea atlantica]MDO6418023.1 EAL domain-containing protein [Amphritea sp. 2_MG-2023]